MTNKLDDDGISHLAMRVLDRTLPRQEWSHASHFALALWILRYRPASSDPESFRKLIIDLNEAHGTANTDTSGYHHTITVASLRAAAACLAEFPPQVPLSVILANLMSGPCGRSDWIFSYWSREALFSVPARRSWVTPDLQALPF